MYMKIFSHYEGKKKELSKALRRYGTNFQQLFVFVRSFTIVSLLLFLCESKEIGVSAAYVPLPGWNLCADIYIRKEQDWSAGVVRVCVCSLKSCVTVCVCETEKSRGRR